MVRSSVGWSPHRRSTNDIVAMCSEYRAIQAVASDCSSRPATGSLDRKSTRLNSSHVEISYAVFCLKKKKRTRRRLPDILYHTPNLATQKYRHKLSVHPHK